MKKDGSETRRERVRGPCGRDREVHAAKDELYVSGEALKSSALAQLYQDALDTRAATVTAKGEYAAASEDAAATPSPEASVAASPAPVGTRPT